MVMPGYGIYIHDIIQNWADSDPVTTIFVASKLSSEYGIGLDKAKSLTNVYLKRMSDKGMITRVQRGVYYKIIDTPFGKLSPDPIEAITGTLMRDHGDVIGYITGPTLLNAIGLSSLVPRELHIATNRYRRRIPDNALVRVHKPITSVNGINAPYLQALEAIEAMDRYHVDAENPGDVLGGMFRASNVDNDRLIQYARRYCGYKTLVKTIDVTIGAE